MDILAATETTADWDGFVGAHRAWLRSVVRRRMADPALVDDVVQETFVRAYRSAGPPPETADEVRAWLAVLAGRACADVWRAHASPAVVRSLDAWPAADDMADRTHAPGSDEHLTALVRRRGIDHSLARLTPRHRRLLELRGVLGMSYEEIAADQRVSVACVTSALERARDRFRHWYLAYEASERAVPAGVVVLRGRIARLRARLGRKQEPAEDRATRGLRLRQWSASAWADRWERLGLLAGAAVSVAVMGMLASAPGTPRGPGSAQSTAHVGGRAPSADVQVSARASVGDVTVVHQPDGPPRRAWVYRAMDGDVDVSPTRVGVTPNASVTHSPESSSVFLRIDMKDPISGRTITVGQTVYCDKGRVATAECTVLRNIPASG